MSKSVYILRSLSRPHRIYTGITSDPLRRLKEHNDGKSIHTNKYRPWKLIVSIQFRDNSTADSFERYLKTGSGRAFIHRHFV